MLEWELLLVSEETANGGELVNIKRQELGPDAVDMFNSSIDWAPEMQTPFKLFNRFHNISPKNP